MKLKTFQNENFKKGKAIIEIKTKNIKIIEGKVDNLLLLKILKIQNRKKKHEYNLQKCIFESRNTLRPVLIKYYANLIRFIQTCSQNSAGCFFDPKNVLIFNDKFIHTI